MKTAFGILKGALPKSFSDAKASKNRFLAIIVRLVNDLGDI